jgi:uncharacterized membrane protein YsdA (DUF1294 family)
MKNIRLSLKKLIPHIFAVVLFLIVSYAYFPSLIEGEEIRQSDVTHFKGAAKEIKDFRERTGEEALWTNRMFGGMPAFLISVQYDNRAKILKNLFHIGERPASMLFGCLLGFYITLLLLGVNPWLSIVGSFAYAFSSYFFIIIAAGHNTKALAISYMAPLIGSIIYSYRRKLLLGMALTGAFLVLLIIANHPQITYYTLIIVVIFGVFELGRSIRNKTVGHFMKVTLLLLIPVILAVGSSLGKLWSVYEYGKHSIRGESPIQVDEENQTTGLDKDYATAWSYGISETFTLLIPNYAGGASQGELSKDSKTYEALKSQNVPPARAKQFTDNAPTYHGDQPFTSGPVYLGALVLFLFVFSLYIVKGPLKWWIISASILGVLLSWGNNFMPLTNFFMDYVPGYNKFRTVSMTLVIVQFTVPFFAFIGLRKLFNSETIDKQRFFKALKNSVFILGGICLLFILIPGIFQDFAGPSDARLPEWLQSALRDDRKSLLRGDAFRSFIFILIGATILWAYFSKKIKYSHTLLLLGAFILIDMWTIDKRYLNEENFAPEREVENPYPKTRADNFILQDKTKNFRVLNLTVSVFNDANTSYYHNSIGGYHGAKLQRYQDMIEFHIQNEIKNIGNSLQGKNARQKLDQTLKKQEVLNMLNTKYIIYNKKSAPVKNPYRLGDAWFADKYRLVPDAITEIKTLNNIDPSKTAVIHEEFEEKLQNDYKKDTTGQIMLTQYEPNYLKYDYHANSEQLVVFSEIYYPDGWELYIDGEESEILRANYVLRAATIPAGEHTIEMKFKPKSFYLGNKISGIVSIILLIFIGLTLVYEGYFYYKRDFNQKQES